MPEKAELQLLYIMFSHFNFRIASRVPWQGNNIYPNITNVNQSLVILVVGNHYWQEWLDVLIGQAVAERIGVGHGQPVAKIQANRCQGGLIVEIWKAVAEIQMRCW